MLARQTSTENVIKINEGVDDTVPELSFPQAMKQVALFAVPFSTLRILFAANIIGNGIAFAKLGAHAAASGSLSTSIYFAVTGPARGALLSTGIMVAKHFGQASEFESNRDADAVEGEYEQISKISKQGLLFGTLLAIPSIGLMYGAGYGLNLIGIPSDVVANTQAFFNATAFGIFPMYWFTTDQQVALGINYKNIPLIFGGLYAGLSMLIGYPLAFGAFGLPALGTTGLGVGMTAGAWISFIGLRVYFLRNEFENYHLFALKLKGFLDEFSHMVKFGLSMGFQALTEWGNLAILSTLLGLAGPKTPIAALASIQCILAYTFATSGLGQTVSVQISNLVGRLNALQQLNQLNQVELMHIVNRNIKKLGYAGITIGLIAASLACGLTIGIPKQIVGAFVTNTVDEETMALAQAMLLVSGIGLMIDTVRNMSASALGGSKDVLFAPILSVITMSVLGLSVGGGLSLFLDWGANWLFITRDVGILLAAIAIALRWFNKDHMPADVSEQTISTSCFGLYSSTKSKKIVQLNEKTILMGESSNAPRQLGYQTMGSVT